MEEKGKGKRALSPVVKWSMLVLLIIGIVWTIFEPTLSTIKNLWPIWAISGLVAITLVILRTAGAQMEKFFQNSVVKKLGIGLLIASILVGFSYLIQLLAATQLITRFGISERLSWIAILAAVPPILAGLWCIFKPTGLPGSPGAIFWGSALISMGVIGIILFTYHLRPHEFFDHRTKEAKAYVTDSGIDKTIYYSPKGSIVDGTELRPMTTDDAKKYITESEKPANTRCAQETQKKKVVKPDNIWQLKAENSRDSVSLKIKLERDDDLLIAKWRGGGFMKGTKNPDGSYDGIWKDTCGKTGKFGNLKFISETEASGWISDTGQKDRDKLFLSKIQ